MCAKHRRTQPELLILTVTAPASTIPLSGSLDPNLAPTIAQVSKRLRDIEKRSSPRGCTYENAWVRPDFSFPLVRYAHDDCDISIHFLVY